MAVRIRKDGRILCAAMTDAEDGDIYIGDGLHYILSAQKKLLVTDDLHMDHGLWWWHTEVPNNIEIRDFYKEPPTWLTAE